MLISMALGAVLLLPSQASPDPLAANVGSGMWLLKVCRDDRDSIEVPSMSDSEFNRKIADAGAKASVALACLAYVKGAADAFAVVRGFCAPQGVTVDQMKMMTKNWLTQHPEHLHKNGARLILETMREKFPCPPLK